MFKLLCIFVFVMFLFFVFFIFVQVNVILLVNVQKVLQINKLIGNDLLLVLILFDGLGNFIYYNVDVLVNLVFIMKLFIIYVVLEMFGLIYQWKIEFYIDGQFKNGVFNGNFYFKGGGDLKLNMEKFWLLMCDLCVNGVIKVIGDLVFDCSYFNILQLLVFNDDGGDDIKLFLVGLDLLLVNLKSVCMVVCIDGNKVNVQMDLLLVNVCIDNQVKMIVLVICLVWLKLCFSLVIQFDGIILLVIGQIFQGCSVQIYMLLFDYFGYIVGVVCGIW